MRNNILILQARLGSTRFPGKVLKEIAGRPLIEYQINRIRASKYLSKLIVAIPSGEQDDLLESFLLNIGVEVYRGELDDVFSRFQGAISDSSAEIVIRSTADCPLFMSSILDEMLEYFERTDVDYLSNAIIPTYPDGLDIEIFKKGAFESLSKSNLTKLQREHVTLGFYDGTHSFKVSNFRNEFDLSSERWTVDYEEDFRFIETIIEQTNPLVSLSEVLQYLESNPQVRNSKPSSYRNIALKGEISNEES